MANNDFTFPIEFTYVPSRNFKEKIHSRTGTFNATIGFNYISGFKSKGDIKLAKDALGLIRKAGIHRKIMTDDECFPEKLRIIHSVADPTYISRVDISPVGCEIIYSDMGFGESDKNRNLKLPVFEARQDSLILNYDFGLFTLRYQETPEHILLSANGCIRSEVEQWH